MMICNPDTTMDVLRFIRCQQCSSVMSYVIFRPGNPYCSLDCQLDHAGISRAEHFEERELARGKKPYDPQNG